MKRMKTTTSREDIKFVMIYSSIVWGVRLNLGARGVTISVK